MVRSFLRGAVAGAVLLAVPQLVQAAPAGLVGRPSPAQTVSFTVHLPLRNEAELDSLLKMQSDPSSPLYHRFLSVAQFRSSYGPTAATMAKAAASLKARGFTVTATSSQTLRFSGASASVAKAFGARLGIVRDAAGTMRVASSTALTLPADLKSMGATVTGFEQRIHVHTNFRQVPLSRNGPFGGYYFDDLKQAYAYPSDHSLDGTGATIGVLMSSDVLDSDTASAFSTERYTAISGKTPPPLLRRVVLGGAPFGGIGNGASDEASIDVQTSQGSAPGAQIVLYNIPSLGDDAIMAGYTDIVEDNLVDVVSSSFGGCELAYTAAYNSGVDFTGVLKAFQQLFEQGASQGISFVASSGDEAGLECPTVAYFEGAPTATFVPSVSWPASDPFVTGVGGTNLQTTYQGPSGSLASLASKYVSENAFGDPEVAQDPYGIGGSVTGGYWGSGSGTSKVYLKAWWQYLIPTPGGSYREVPDISMQMGGCPGGISVLPCHGGDSYSIYFIGGSEYGFIGTSLSSPEFAGVLGLKVALGKSRLGLANPYIYRIAAAQAALPPTYGVNYLHQGIPGYNGVVTATNSTPGYNPILGVGTPFTANFIGVPQLPLAGNPQTYSNP